MIIDAINALAQLIANTLGRPVRISVSVATQKPDRDGDPVFTHTLDFQATAKPGSKP